MPHLRAISVETPLPANRDTGGANAARTRRSAAIAALSLVLAACATTVGSVAPPAVDGAASPSASPTSATSPTRPPVESPPPAASTSPSSTEATVAPSTAPAPPATTPTPTETDPPSTTAPELPDDVANPDCVTVATTPTFDVVAAETSTPIRSLWIENGFRDVIAVGDLVDTCVDNGIDDITGAPTLRHDDEAVAAAVRANVERQQRKLNELFAAYGTRPLAVDGDSGRYTGQRLCAARVALGLEPSMDDMAAGSAEQVVLLQAPHLPTPETRATETRRWALIDRTCQMMFIGAGADLVFVFPTSTGTEGFETRLQDRAPGFRFNPAVDNGGWHDSTEFPVGVDNPLNGNLYKPLYFDLGQAIHGATNVPPAPASKGCARLTVPDQEALLTFLGLLDATEETWRRQEIDFTVTVQGDFVGR